MVWLPKVCWGQSIFIGSRIDKVEDMIEILEKQQGKVLPYVSLSLYPNEYRQNPKDWTVSNKKRVLELWKGIKEISYLELSYASDSLDVFLLDMLEVLPPIKQANIVVGSFLYFQGGFEKHPYTEGYFDRRIEFRVQDKLTYRSDFQLAKSPKWDGKTGFFFPEVDTVVLSNSGAEYLHPSFGREMKSLEVLIIAENKSVYNNTVRLPTLQESTNLRQIIGRPDGSEGKLIFPKAIRLDSLEKLIIRNFDCIEFEDPTPVTLPNLKMIDIYTIDCVLNLQHINAPNLIDVRIRVEQNSVLLGTAAQLERLDLCATSIESDLSIYPALNTLRFYQYSSENNYEARQYKRKKYRGKKYKTKKYKDWEYKGREYKEWKPPATIGDLQSLDTLMIYKVKALPESFGELKNLRYLQIGDAMGKKLPESFGKLEQLNTLEINNAGKLPSTFQELKNLRSLKLYNHCAKELPSSLGILAGQLTMLTLHMPRLKTLPNSFFDNNSLEKLVIKAPKLTLASKDFERMKRLHLMLLVLQRLEGDFEAAAFSNFTVLKVYTLEDEQFAGKKQPDYFKLMKLTYMYYDGHFKNVKL